ncbi:MAG: serine/threonine-protein kinase [Myxococcaceae bacterium]
MGQRVGKYEVLTRLTKGGMAELDLAWFAGPGGFRKYVVLKRILPEAAGDENFVNMFLDEARVTAAFSHPNICGVFELGNDKQEGLFVALEFIAGQDLNQVVAACARQQAVLPVGFSASVVNECAQALHYAHTFKKPNGEDAGVIHRDVAQKNVMVTYDGQVKLLDFGIAKAKGALAKTRAGTVKGTAGYMSPEQVRGETIDGRSDVFALGVVLWEMVTGRRLFSADTELLELRMILQEPIKPPHELEPSVPKELSDVAMKALERDLKNRFRSAREMSKALTSSCAHLLFDAEERADFMRQRFSEKITSAQKLFDVASSKDTSEIDAAVEEYRRSSVHDREQEPSVPRKPAVSANKLKAARSGQSLGKLKKVKSRRETDEDQPSSRRDDFPPTDALVPVTPPSSSKLWPVVAVVFALVVGLVVFKVMQGHDDPTPRPPPTGEIPGIDTAENPPPKKEPRVAEIPGIDTTETPPPKDPPKKDPVPKKDDAPRTPKAAKEQGEITLALFPEATVSKGSQRLGQGSLISFSLPVGTHLVTIRGDDGVKRKLSLQISAGKNKPQRYRLEDLPPE